jgi:5-carboxymethyl-2-hydroxymuconate isomerase
MNGQPSVHLHIEELVLHGFPSSDRHRIGEAVRRELTRLFAEERTPRAFAKSAEIDRLNGGSFQTTGTARPEATGAQVARAVFGGLRQ